MRSTIRITLLYLLFAGLWIRFSDLFLERLTDNAAEITLLQSYKGGVFVVGSALLLFVLMSREFRSREQAEQERRSAREAMEAQLAKSRSLHASAQTFSAQLNFEELAAEVARQCVDSFQARTAWLCHRTDEGTVRTVAVHPPSLTAGGWVCGGCREVGNGEPPACLGAAEGLPRVIDDLSVAENPPEWKDEALKAGVRSVAFFPLRSHDSPLGVLVVGGAETGWFSLDRLDFYQAYGHQAAVALESACLFTEKTALFNNLETANQELTRAYDRTLEGWSHALELRDIETHGHAQRVMRASVLLARAVGIPEAELVHVRRGALLHDIGKLAIPDRILLKAGPLTDSEWETMCLHPLYAQELLAPIPFLRAALDIAFHHHEWWNGAGYPAGLRGEEIPLSARVFAVIDVVDALCSDRPYCPRWPWDKVVDYIRQQAGKQFDPQIVEVFLEHLDEILPVIEARSAHTRSGSAREEWRYYVEIDTNSPDENASAGAAPSESGRAETAGPAAHGLIPVNGFDRPRHGSASVDDPFRPPLRDTPSEPESEPASPLPLSGGRRFR